MSAVAWRPSGLAWPRTLSALLLLLATVLLLYRDTAIGMVSIWARSDTFAHAFLVPPIVAWLIWRRRHELAAQRPEPNAWLLLPIAAMAAAWLLGDLVGVNSVTQFAFTALLVLVTLALLGLPASRSILFPLGFLFFAVPIGEFLLPVLMTGTADFTVTALRASGIPVYRDGLQFVIPSGTWSVVEACSGVRYLIASLTVGTLFAYLNYRSTRRRLIFIGISVLVPILANWVRAYLIVMLGHLSDNRLATGADHLLYGWVFFGVVMVIMFVIGMRWADTDPAPSVDGRPARPAAGDPARADRPWAMAAALALLVALPQLLLWGLDRSDDRRAPTLVPLGALAEGWQPGAAAFTDWRPAFQQPSAEAQARYGSAGGAVGVYIGYYRDQDYRRKLVSSANGLVVGEGTWVQVERGERTMQTGAGPLTVRTAWLRGSRVPGQVEAPRLRVWQIYWVDSHVTASDAWAKVYGALSRLLGRGDDAAVILLYAAEDARGGTDALLESFARGHLAALRKQLEATRAGH
ncbi:MAG: exosortase A [Pseudomonadota bacterium]